jgi:hypothetical protein
MSYSILLQEEAIMEGRQIFEEYEKKPKGPGFRFLESLERAYDNLIQGQLLQVY